MSASTFHVERPTEGYRAEQGSKSRLSLAALRYPTLTASVPKELVHRAAVAEVMLTDWERHDDTHFRVAAQWPRGHNFFTPVDGQYDPLMATETIRQVGYLLAHAEFGVPFGHRFLMWNMEVSVDPEHLQVRQTPASLDIEVTCTHIRRRGSGELAGLRYEAAVLRDGQLAATGSVAFTCTNPAAYERVRGEHLHGYQRPLPLTAPAAPQSVGRTSPVDVVLSPVGEANRWRLRVDTRHPVLFDHPVDHVPGMMLVEASRQAAAAVLGRSSLLPLNVACGFERYVELSAPCTIEADTVPELLPDGRRRVLVSGHQDGELCFTSTVTAAAA
ncbi:ScbA/BarX family gamma-butyrolactone biosynthesis protein [Streptomyces sp. NPDC004244]|uniref:ScbA/BarX family gamma-butyrolactone biosynthesis protein n=1 Tax=Streptomyces sp. NPDC101206 TaxID=3366128 RepID=UPI00382CBE93